MKTELKKTIILESILTSLDPTVDYIDNNGKLVYVKKVGLIKNRNMLLKCIMQLKNLS